MGIPLRELVRGARGITAGSRYFQEPLSFVLGIYKDDEFLEFRLDSRRFEPFDC